MWTSAAGAMYLGTAVLASWLAPDLVIAWTPNVVFGIFFIELFSQMSAAGTLLVWRVGKRRWVHAVGTLLVAIIFIPFVGALGQEFEVGGWFLAYLVLMGNRLLSMLLTPKLDSDTFGQVGRRWAVAFLLIWGCLVLALGLGGLGLPEGGLSSAYVQEHLKASDDFVGFMPGFTAGLAIYYFASAYIDVRRFTRSTETPRERNSRAT